MRANNSSELPWMRRASGVSLEKILQLVVPLGWFLPVLPGTRFVTVGGAIASDVHGKNHHRDGSFSEFVNSLRLMLASGEVINCSKTENTDIFHATCGGMGLTGVIIDCNLQLVALGSVQIRQRSLVAENLQQVFQHFESHTESHYSVAWLDCMASGAALGRSVFFHGEHQQDNERNAGKGLSVSVPFSTPAILLNKYTIGAFNSCYFALHKRLSATQPIHYEKFFFPLDRIKNWNRLYGRRGFLQYQFVVPTEVAFVAITEILGEVVKSGKGSFLSVLKKLGPANANTLSFPIEGYTLALDFKVEKSLFPLLDRLDAIVLANRGRLYLAKDARMSEHTFKQAYPLWEQFMAVRDKIDPQQLFGSLQSQRLGL